jgi:predicted esterase
LSLAVLGAVVLFWRWVANRPKTADPAQVARFQPAIQAEPGLVSRAYVGPDRGVILTGTLEGRNFYVAVPKSWNHAAVVFSNGYSLPGSPTDVSWKALQPGDKGFLRALYASGYLIATIAYDKSGLGVESGVRNTLRLNEFVHHLGASPVYSIGTSMGGSVTVNMIQRQKRPFQGALALCGVDADWTGVFGQLIDLRAAYEYFTRNTPYALPGSTDPQQDILNPQPPQWLGFAQPLWAYVQVKRVLGPLDRLFLAAKKNPNGTEARLIRQIAEAAGVEQDYVSFAFPIFSVAFGIGDMNATLGGSPYDNGAKVFHVSSLSAEENEALNRGIRRIHANPPAVANANRWKATGRFDTPLVTLHNVIDPLVSIAQTTMLKQAVEASNNTQNLYEITAPTMILPSGDKGLRGTTHCGFTVDQVMGAMRELELRSSPSGKEAQVFHE